MSNCHVDLLYWYIQEDDIESAFSLVQKDAVELVEFVNTTVDNPFSMDILGSKEGTKRKMLTIFNCIERLFVLMEMIEEEFENSPAISPSNSMEDTEQHALKIKLSAVKPSIEDTTKQKEYQTRFKITTPLSRKHGEEAGFGTNNLSTNLSKMKYFLKFLCFIEYKLDF